MRRHQIDARGDEVNVIEKSVDIAIGSGNHAITFLSRTPQGRLLELPLSWYSRPAAWAMSPGYDRDDQEIFGVKSPAHVCSATRPDLIRRRSIAADVMGRWSSICRLLSKAVF